MKVLIIEDDMPWAQMLCRYAAEVGAYTSVAVSGQQAIEMIDNWRPDVLVLDMLLAGETGMALLNELRSHADLATLPVVVCSSIELSLKELRPFGVCAVLDKNQMTPDDIRTVFRRYCCEPT